MKIWIVSFFIAIITMACGSTGGKNKDTSMSTSTEANVDGAKIFKQSCAFCHGNDGRLNANGSRDLTTSNLDLNARIAIITKGKGQMSPFDGILEPNQIRAVAEYTMNLQ